jgi:hypothetical protein
MDSIIAFFEKYQSDTLGYSVLAVIITYFSINIFSYLKIRISKIKIEDGYLVKSGLLGTTKIYYGDISNVSFVNFQYADQDIPQFDIYIEIIDIHKNSISIFINSLSQEDIKRMFTYIVTNVSSLKDNQDYMNLANGNYTYDDFYRLAGVKDEVDLLYHVDFSKIKNTPLMNVLKYTIVAGTILFFALLLIGIFYIK